VDTSRCEKVAAWSDAGSGGPPADLANQQLFASSRQLH
jgi:hypothetical protein